MSYSAHAYRDMSKLIAKQISEIMESPMDEDAVEIASETVKLIADDLADLFEADNPKGFDRIRFMTDSKISEN